MDAEQRTMGSATTRDCPLAGTLSLEPLPVWEVSCLILSIYFYIRISFNRAQVLRTSYEMFSQTWKLQWVSGKFLGKTDLHSRHSELPKVPRAVHVEARFGCFYKWNYWGLKETTLWCINYGVQRRMNQMIRRGSNYWLNHRVRQNEPIDPSGHNHTVRLLTELSCSVANEPIDIQLVTITKTINWTISLQISGLH